VRLAEAGAKDVARLNAHLKILGMNIGAKGRIEAARQSMTTKKVSTEEYENQVDQALDGLNAILSGNESAGIGGKSSGPAITGKSYSESLNYPTYDDPGEE
jgi:hypothetical protein